MSDNLRFSPNFSGKSAYEKFDNYDAIEIGSYKEIPSDYNGLMGVPITFLDKYNPDQFEIVGYEKSYDLQQKTYGPQIQVDKSGNRSNVTKLNDGAVIKIDSPPSGITYYIVDGDYFVQRYKRIFIRRHRNDGHHGVKNEN